MRPYEILDPDQILEYIDLVTDHFHIVESFTITPPSVHFDDYDVVFTFEGVTNQETRDEYIFNESEEFIFKVFGPELGFFNDIGFRITFYYYELDKADIDDTKSYDELKHWEWEATGSGNFSKTFDKPTYVLKNFQVEVMKLE